MIVQYPNVQPVRSRLFYVRSKRMRAASYKDQKQRARIKKEERAAAAAAALANRAAQSINGDTSTGAPTIDGFQWTHESRSTIAYRRTESGIYDRSLCSPRRRRGIG